MSTDASARVPKSTRSLSLSSARCGLPLYNDAGSRLNRMEVSNSPRRSRSGGSPPPSLLLQCDPGAFIRAEETHRFASPAARPAPSSQQPAPPPSPRRATGDHRQRRTTMRAACGTTTPAIWLPPSGISITQWTPCCPAELISRRARSSARVRTHRRCCQHAGDGCAEAGQWLCRANGADAGRHRQRCHLPRRSEYPRCAEAELKTTQSDLPLVINDAVTSYISYFSNTTIGRNTIVRSSASCGPLQATSLNAPCARKGCPQDLIYQAVAESGFQPQAVNGRSGAGGHVAIHALPRRIWAGAQRLGG